MPKPCPRYRLFNQDCLDVVPELEPKSIDTVICDPPYGINFMGKQWDHGVPGMLFWARIRKVCKPGALLLAFGGTRTYHRLACAIEDGGWQIRDCMMWLYGSGFPKSLDIGKATENVEQWRGFGSNLKPAFEPIIIAMKPFRGTLVDNALAYAVAGFNIDAGRVGVESVRTTARSDSKHKKSNSLGDKWSGIVDESPRVGRWPANLILSHHSECVQVGTKKVKGGNDPRCADGSKSGHNFHGFDKKHKHDDRACTHEGYADADGLETVEAWECHEDCPVRMLDEQSGVSRSIQGSSQEASKSPFLAHQWKRGASHSDTGGASRFFYTAKASRRERDDGLPEGMTNTHSTVKPLAIMEYLCRLTRPPSGGVVFDPFMGSGTTGVACASTKRKFIGCEIDTEHGYFEIARRRIKKAYKGG